ncbi:ABC transporter ATP-binding protein [Aestuariivivens marinum]|uniref:ABC transporter ATP-binding protein n=1 Tax=Aestuariivivens marinum TaxID=2913555 RepID=UPI001F596B46|nr:ABC transporter ATP-binding protein [Aestuariivivens marinum]
MSKKDHINNKDVLVKVEGVSKKFCKDLKKGLWYGVKDLFSGISRSEKDVTLRPKEFWAVKDVSFELRRGECLGLIGHNGAGKSTLLKILNGLINPDEGRVTIKGRVGALIELGAGFNPILTGRENIYNNGAVLGFSKAEIDAKFQDIIDFAELDEFIDMPIQHYSSGMRVRLGFAVAAQMEPDVLIIDEVLAVGDLGFMLKCFKTIDTILPNTAVIFVSHNMPMVSRICTQTILLKKGIPKYAGSDVANAIDLYYSNFASNTSSLVFTDNTIDLLDAKLISHKAYFDGMYQLEWNQDLKLHFRFNSKNVNSSFEFFIIITDKEQRSIGVLEKNIDIIRPENGRIEFYVVHEKCQLSKGIYSINLAVRKKENKEPVLRVNDVLSFQILHESHTWEPFLLKSRFEYIKPLNTNE